MEEEINIIIIKLMAIDNWREKLGSDYYKIRKLYRKKHEYTDLYTE